MTDNIQADYTLKMIEDEKLCEEREFQQIVDNYRLLKLVRGGRLTVSKNETGIKVEPSIWPRGFERILIEALEEVKCSDAKQES